MVLSSWRFLFPLSPFSPSLPPLPLFPKNISLSHLIFPSQSDEDESVCPGRVQNSNQQQEEDTRTLSIVYQSIVIFLTLLFALVFLKQAITLFSLTKSQFFFFLDCFSFCFSCLYSFCFFLFFSYPSLRSEGSSKAKTFIFRLGAVIVTAFLLRCVLLLILLAIDLTSDIYLFITLMITEVLMMLLIAIELNKGFYRLMFSGVQTSVGATLTPTKMSDGSRASIYQHDSDHN